MISVRRNGPVVVLPDQKRGHGSKSDRDEKVKVYLPIAHDYTRLLAKSWASAATELGAATASNQLVCLSPVDLRPVGFMIAGAFVALEMVFPEGAEDFILMPAYPEIHPGGSDHFVPEKPAYIAARRSAGVRGYAAGPP